VEEGFYTVDEAARILKRTPGRVGARGRADERGGQAPVVSCGHGRSISLCP
jgi:hypothetical protein